MMRSVKMMWIAGVMAVIGWLVIFLIVLGHIPAGFLLNFLGYGASLAGLLLGLVGILDHIRPGRD